MNPRPLFVATLAAGSFLLFLMQPMVARIALPRLGGTPAVWNSALLAYQALLLGGYAYAHALSRLPPGRQAIVHLALFALAAAWLPIGLVGWTLPPGADPFLWVPALFAASIGPLFLVVSAQAPLMQRWFARAAPGVDPFPLYAASNLGSFAGLIAYPLLAEPLLALHAQRWAWSLLYAGLAGLVLLCARALPAHAPPGPRVAARVRTRDLLWWAALAAVPSGLILSTTSHLATDIVAMPLLWVVPLGVYLLSFVLAFGEGWAGRIAWGAHRLLPFVLILAAGTAFAEGAGSAALAAGSALLGLAVTATALHRQLYLARPEPAALTAFYLAIAAGGVAGGLFCAIVAPALFDWIYEQPLLIAAAALLARPRPPMALLRRFWRWRGRTRAAAAMGGGALALTAYASGMIVPAAPVVASAAIVALVALAIAAIGRTLLFALVIAALMMAAGGWRALLISTRLDARERSYFGVYTIADRPREHVRELISGTTLHGVQRTTPGEETRPTSYYAPRSGVGLALRLAPALYGPAARVGVVGLGAGTLACYARGGQDWRFYEIDPVIVGIARDPKRFSFLARCKPDARILIGDARLTLAHQTAAPHDLLAIDAFSSDAVPIHLLTLEAFDVYAATLVPRGLLLIHVSNRYLDLAAVVAAAARAQGWRAAIRDYTPDAADTAAGAGRSVWIALTRDQASFDRLTTDDGRAVGGWAPLAGRPGLAPWTDDHASILAFLR